jgi:hypothetical protein
MQVSVHEGTHCTVLTLIPGSCDGIAPFPHVIEHGGGTALIGGQTFSDVETADQAVLWEAPQIVAAVLIVLLHALARRVRDERVALVFRLWILGACFDLLGNTSPFIPATMPTDWNMMAQRYGLTEANRLPVSALAWCIGFGGLLLPIRWGFDKARRRLRDFAPLPGVYAAVSLIAIVVSLGVDVPSSDRGAPWFWVPVALHAVTVVVCLLVLGFAHLRANSGLQADAGSPGDGG